MGPAFVVSIRHVFLSFFSLLDSRIILTTHCVSVIEEDMLCVYLDNSYSSISIVLEFEGIVMQSSFGEDLLPTSEKQYIHGFSIL